jgi:selenocysteine lyase/cysteine desulfurase
MMIDVARARRDTPGCVETLHFDNAGASLMPTPVTATVLDHIKAEAASGGYAAAAEAEDRIEGVYESIGSLLNCSTEEVAIVENATRAWDMAFYGLSFQTGDRVLTSRSAYASNFIAYLQRARREGISIEALPADASGQISVDALKAAVDERVKLIAITHVPTNNGLVNPAAAVGEVARDHDIPYLLDACQSVGQLPLDVEALGCDMLSATSRKYLRGPRGVGFLYVREEMLSQIEPPFLDLHAAEWTAPGEFRVRADARRFENWESNIAAKLGMGTAIDYALSWGIDTIGHFVGAVAGLLRERLAEIPGVSVTDIGEQKCGIVTFTTPLDAAEVRDSLRADAINVAVSTRASTLLDMDDRGLSEVVRASVHYFNTEREIDHFCDALSALLRPGQQ